MKDAGMGLYASQKLSVVTFFCTL